MKKSKRENKKRKPYRSPRLVSYGDLRTLTRAKGGSKPDAAMPKSKAGGGGG